MGEMPFEVARQALLSAYESGELREVIPSTMGEPLLYSHFEDLLSLCQSLDLPLNLTTNGSFPGFKTPFQMIRLLQACSDIKVSAMGFSDALFSEMMPGLSYESWKSNLTQLASLRQELPGCATLSLQVTLHEKIKPDLQPLLRFAESIGIHRVKCNLPVFLSCAPQELRSIYQPSAETLDYFRQVLQSTSLKLEGSFFHEKKDHQKKDGLHRPENCRFLKELWVLPDGSREHCPNPERRFGDRNAPAAQCETCPIF